MTLTFNYKLAFKLPTFLFLKFEPFQILPSNLNHIDYLKVSDELETGDLDLEFQGQICHESSNVCVIPC